MDTAPAAAGPAAPLAPDPLAGLDPDLRAAFVSYLLRLGDSALILSHRLSQWSGLGPALEEDIALSNLALDHLGQAHTLLDHAGQVEGQGRDADRLAFFRDGRAYRNLLLVEQPNGPAGAPDFAITMVRSAFYDAAMMETWARLASGCRDPQLAAIAGKAEKEARYHWRHSSAWVRRLGDGTEESHRRTQAAVDGLWRFTGEVLTPRPDEVRLVEAGLAIDRGSLRQGWMERIADLMAAATLRLPAADAFMRTGGLDGLHTEHLDYILAEMQSLPRSMPGARW